HEWWRQLLSGDFLDVIHDCPYEMHELTTSRPVSDILKTLNENQLEVMYYWVIRQEKPKQIAARRGQSTRNILKVYTGLIKGLWKKLHDRLAPRFDAGLPLTFAQKQFVEDYRANRLKIRMPKSKKGKKGKKKTTVDDSDSE
ncbi:sigma-70 family RNA polymerase sigma factor, partial [Christensenellaceae bacterium OttesenSCG-928-M15]|nr:sigma-70 family RNA polymerase sigma factor [Christensenellaceae bacterium OttesenSCG-928-M15]